MVNFPAETGTVMELHDESVLGSGMSMFVVLMTIPNKIMTTSVKRIFCYLRF